MIGFAIGNDWPTECLVACVMCGVCGLRLCGVSGVCGGESRWSSRTPLLKVVKPLLCRKQLGAVGSHAG